MTQDFLTQLANDFPVMGTIIDVLQHVKDRHVLVVSHDDPDGITSGLLLVRTLRKYGCAKIDVRFPPRFFLEYDELVTFTRETGMKKDGIVFCLDKGVNESYDRFRELVDTIVIIDHHPMRSIPKQVVVFNPLTKLDNVFCSNSHLIYLILSLAGIADDSDLFLNLLGLTGDFAVKTVPDGKIAPWAQVLFPYARERFPHYFESKSLRPTWYDVDQRELTSLLHQVAEVISAVSGNGFQFFYNDRSPELANLDPPRFIFDQLDEYVGSAHLGSEKTVETFIDALSDSRKVKLIYQLFLEDWDRFFSLMDGTVEILAIRDVHVYLFMGQNMRLTPMLGSPRLHALAHRNGHSNAVICILNIKPEHLHFSLRATGRKLHCGKICSNMETRMKYVSDGTQISGGGHPQAAELNVRNPQISTVLLLREFFAYMNELWQTPNDVYNGTV